MMERAPFSRQRGRLNTKDDVEQIGICRHILGRFRTFIFAAIPLTQFLPLSIN